MKNSWISRKNNQSKNDRSLLFQSLEIEVMKHLTGGSKNEAQWSRVANDFSLDVAE
ncbi:MAG: hypothetical protein AAFW75_13315 [Cyanobacteria bacterium J06636_16]